MQYISGIFAMNGFQDESVKNVHNVFRRLPFQYLMLKNTLTSWCINIKIAVTYCYLNPARLCHPSGQTSDFFLQRKRVKKVKNKTWGGCGKIFIFWSRKTNQGHKYWVIFSGYPVNMSIYIIVEYLRYITNFISDFQSDNYCFCWFGVLRQNKIGTGSFSNHIEKKTLFTELKSI